MNLRTLWLSLVVVGCTKPPAPPDAGPPPMPMPPPLVILDGVGVAQTGLILEKDGEKFHLLELGPTRGRASVPFSKAAKLIRPATSAQIANAWRARLEAADGPVDSRHVSERVRSLQRVLVRGDAEAKVDALASLYRSPFRPSFTETKFIDRLESLVLPELVLATETPATLSEVETRAAALTTRLHALHPAFSADAGERPPEKPLEPPVLKDPFRVANSEYLGSFVAGDALVASDPAFVSVDGGVAIASVPGRWHAYLALDEEGPTMLFAFVDPKALDGGKPPAATELAGEVAVESGEVAMLDEASHLDPMVEDAMLFRLFSAEVFAERGAVTGTGGDGPVPLLVGKHGSRAAWVGLDFAHDADGGLSAANAFLKQVKKTIRR